MNVVSIALAVAAGLAATATIATPRAEQGDQARQIARPPADLSLDPFYARYVDALGIPVTSSDRVPDEALLRARDIVIEMTADRPDVRRALVRQHTRIAIMAIDEGTVDLPEQRDWRKPAADDPRLSICERKHYGERIGRLSDREYWNGRARGMGGILTSGAAENLMAVPSTRYFGENIFVHEFAHDIMAGIEAADPALLARIRRAYDAAMAAGKWKGEYGAVTVEEYWAEGTQFWFNSNKLVIVDGRRILSDADLADYDVALYNVLEEVYGAGHHRLAADAFYMHPARVPPGPLPVATAEQC